MFFTFFIIIALYLKQKNIFYDSEFFEIDKCRKIIFMQSESSIQNFQKTRYFLFEKIFF